MLDVYLCWLLNHFGTWTTSIGSRSEVFWALVSDKNFVWTVGALKHRKKIVAGQSSPSINPGSLEGSD